MDAKLWQYLYHNQDYRSERKATGKHLEESGKCFTETSADDCATVVDQLCDQLLNDQLRLHKSNLLGRAVHADHHHAHHHLRNSNRLRTKNLTNYSRLRFGFDLECRPTHSGLFRRLFYKFYFYKHFNGYFRPKYLTPLLLIFALIGIMCILRASNYFASFAADSRPVGGGSFSASLPFSSFAAFKDAVNFSSAFGSLQNQLRIERAEQAANDRLNSFERVLTVETDCASYVGTVEDNAFEFLGLQYAVPPLNALRFKPTVPIWNSTTLCRPKQIRKAKKFSPECFQINPFNKKIHGNEDCLYLDVYTPRLDSSAFLDVMIFFHPGFLQFGSGHMAGLTPSASLARKLNVVFVSLNYRLDALGFLPLGQFVNSTNKENSTTKDQKTTNDPNNLDNCALHDQLTAVEWVRRNIRSFGGNPNRLTVFGSDSAATLLALLSNQQFRESVSKVWLAGPAVYLNKQFSLNKFLAKNRDQKTKSSKFNSCNTIKCFQELSPRDVIFGFLDGDEPEFKINDQNDLPIQGIFPNQWIIVDDNLVKEAYPFDRRLDYNRLQFLIGTSSNAVEWWPGPNDIRGWSWLQYAKYVSTSLDSFNSSISQAALQHYPPDLKSFKTSGIESLVNNRKTFDQAAKQPTKKQIGDQWENRNEINQLNSENYANKNRPTKSSPEALYTRMVSDIKQTCPINVVAENLVKQHNSTVFRYIATSEPSYPVKLFGHKSRYGFHLWDLIAFFDQVHMFIEHPTKSDLLFVKQMQNMVMNFLKKDEYSMDGVLDLKNLVDFRTGPFERNRADLTKRGSKKKPDKSDGRAKFVDDKLKSSTDSAHLTKWLAYPKSLALVSDDVKFVKEYNSERCRFWQSVALDRYAWVV